MKIETVKLKQNREYKEISERKSAAIPSPIEMEHRHGTRINRRLSRLRPRNRPPRAGRRANAHRRAKLHQKRHKSRNKSQFGVIFEAGGRRNDASGAALRPD